MWEVGANDQIFKAIDYKPLVIAYHNGAAVRISDVGDAVDSVEDLRNAGYANGKPSVLVIIFRQPGANIIETVDRIRAVLPQIQAAIPAAIDLQRRHGSDPDHPRFGPRRGAHAAHLGGAGGPGGLRVSARTPRSTFIPSVAVPVSLLGTFGVMYLLRLQPRQPLADGADHLHRLRGGRRHRGDREHHALPGSRASTRLHAALKGAQEIGSTVLTMSISLVAVFIPLLLMGGIVGRLFREFAVTLSVAIAGFHGGFAHGHAHDVRPPAEGARIPRLALPRRSRRVFNWVVDAYTARRSRWCCAIRSSPCWFCWPPSA